MRISTEYKTFELDQPLRVGILSDSQISPFSWKNNRMFERNLIRSLQCLKRQRCNVILFAGDICNIASFYAYFRFKRAFRLVFSDAMPVTQFIMGNHDYFPAFTPRHQKRAMFTKHLGQSPYTHYVINGHHFIGCSPDCRKQRNGYSRVLQWLEDELTAATRDSGDRPVFVLTHNSATGTVYGSDRYGDLELGKVLEKFPTVVNFAGHTHFPLLDERSIHQEKFTSVNTQATAYVELDKGLTNGPVPPNAHISPMGYIMDFHDDAIELLRYNFGTGFEEKANMRWSLPTHICPSEFRYTDARFDPQTATAEDYPVMPEPYGRSERIALRTYLLFSKGTDRDFVHHYKVEFSDGKIQYYASDFYKGLTNPDDEVCLPIYEKAAGVYDVEIRAVNSRGLESQSCTRIRNVRISSYRHYPLVLAPDVKFL